MDLKQIEKVVASIQSNLFRNSNSFAVGMLKSHFKGAGLQFKEHQVYAPGDDVRFIDWKLSAKSQNTYVKTFEEERNIEIVPFIDITQTMLMGYKGISKLQAAIEITCLLYLLADKSKDKVRPIIFKEKAILLPPLSGHEGIVLLISMLQKQNIINSKGQVNLQVEIDDIDQKKKTSLLKSLVAKGKEVVFLSDFSSFKNLELINKLIYRRNMHCFKVISPIDEHRSSPFSILTKKEGKKVITSGNTKEEVDLHGRWKRLDVSDRYMENFVREML